MGEVLNHFTLKAPFHNENAGFSKWTTATRDGESYFLKEFVDPIYPAEGIIADDLRRERIQECNIYESEKILLYSKINAASNGNLTRVTDFFRHGSHYYIAMPLVYAQTMTAREVANLSPEDKRLICLTAADSVMCLHEAGIVHTDLKETNVLIKKSKMGRYVTKIIDYDSCFFEDNPPESEDDIGGDQVYMAPETLLFLCGEEAVLSHKIDVFALGILFHQYFVGELPSFNTSEFGYVGEAVLEDSPVTISEEIPDDMKEMIRKMLLADPAERLELSEVCKVLRKESQKDQKNWFKAAGDLI